MLTGPQGSSTARRVQHEVCVDVCVRVCVLPALKGGERCMRSCLEVGGSHHGIGDRTHGVHLITAISPLWAAAASGQTWDFPGSVALWIGNCIHSLRAVSPKQPSINSWQPGRASSWTLVASPSGAPAGSIGSPPHAMELMRVRHPRDTLGSEWMIDSRSRLRGPGPERASPLDGVSVPMPASESSDRAIHTINSQS